jgi:hypothetical protein
MSVTILLLTQGSNSKRFGRRIGDLFDFAFIDAVRTLDGQGSDAKVLIPWVADLAPLITAATLDTSPSFDPEAGEGPRETRGRLVPYLPPGDEDSFKADDVFWRAAHLSLGGPEPKRLSEILNGLDENATIHVVMLGSPRSPAILRKALRRKEVRVTTFGSLLSRSQAARAIGVKEEVVVNLEDDLSVVDDDVDSERFAEWATERASEEQLERYLPFGLLLQHKFGEMFDGEDEVKS